MLDLAEAVRNINDPQLLERLYDPRYRRQPCSIRQPQRSPRRRQHADIHRKRLLPEHPHRRRHGNANTIRFDQSIYQPGAAGPGGSCFRRLYRLPCERRPMQPTRRFPNGAASPRRSSSTPRQTSAMPCWSTRRPSKRLRSFRADDVVLIAPQPAHRRRGIRRRTRSTTRRTPNSAISIRTNTITGVNAW